MSKYYVKPALLISLVAAGVLVLAAGAICGVSYLSAARTGAEFESSLSAAQKLVTTNNEGFQQELARLAGVESVTAAHARHALRLSLRRPGPEGTALALRWLKESQRGPARGYTPVRAEIAPQVLKEAGVVLSQHRSSDVRFRRTVSQITNNYKASLDSGWGGFWLQAAGYPHASLTPVKPKAKAPAPAKALAKPKASPAEQPARKAPQTAAAAPAN